MTEAPLAFLLHGFLGVGKTTVAKRLEKEQSALRFTHDEWMSRLYGDDPPATEFAGYAQRVFDVMEETWTRCITLKTNIVLDFGFWSKVERIRVRELAASLGAKAVLCRVSCPDEVAWARIEKRNESLAGNLYIAPNTYQVLRQRFEPLTADEERIEIATAPQPLLDRGQN